MGNSITALVQENRLDELRVRLSEPDCDPNQVSSEGLSPLQIACQMNSVAAVALLVAHPRIQLNLAQRRGPNHTEILPSLPPVAIAVTRNHANVLKLLLEAGADANQKWGDSDACSTPLYSAALFGHAAIVKLLIQHGALVTNAKHNPLFMACTFGNENVVKILLDAGARAVIEVENDVDADLYGARMRPLHIAAVAGTMEEYSTDSHQPRRKYVDCVRMLLEAGADPNAFSGVVSVRSMTALHFASQLFQFEIVRLLLDTRAEINARALPGGETPLLLAVFGSPRGNRQHQLETVKLLLSRGGSPNICNNERMLPIHAAVGVGAENVLRLLLSMPDSNVDARGIGGMTPLMLASAKDNVNIARILLEAGADVSLTDDNGHTAEYLSKRGLVSSLIRARLPEAAPPAGGIHDIAHAPLQYGTYQIDQGRLEPFLRELERLKRQWTTEAAEVIREFEENDGDMPLGELLQESAGDTFMRTLNSSNGGGNDLQAVLARRQAAHSKLVMQVYRDIYRTAAAHAQPPARVRMTDNVESLTTIEVSEGDCCSCWAPSFKLPQHNVEFSVDDSMTAPPPPPLAARQRPRPNRQRVQSRVSDMFSNEPLREEAAPLVVQPRQMEKAPPPPRPKQKVSQAQLENEIGLF